MAPKAVFLGGEVDFQKMSVGERGELVFDWVDLSRSRFLHCDLSKVKFLDVTWDHPCEGVLKSGLWRWGLYEERLWRRERHDRETRAAIDTDYLSHLGRLYRAIKAYYRHTGEHHLVGHFHYGLMEAQWYQKGAGETESGLSWLKRKWKGLVSWRKKWVSWEAAYRYTSGYGEDYAWAGLMLVLVLFIFAGFYWFAAFYWGLGAPEVVKAPWWKQGLHSLLYSFQAGTLGRVSFYGFPSALRVRMPFLAESILVPVQFAFFALALRNRFRR